MSSTGMPVFFLASWREIWAHVQFTYRRARPNVHHMFLFVSVSFVVVINTQTLILNHFNFSIKYNLAKRLKWTTFALLISVIFLFVGFNTAVKDMNECTKDTKSTVFCGGLKPAQCYSLARLLGMHTFTAEFETASWVMNAKKPTLWISFQFHGDSVKRGSTRRRQTAIRAADSPPPRSLQEFDFPPVISAFLPPHSWFSAPKF